MFEAIARSGMQFIAKIQLVETVECGSAIPQSNVQDEHACWKIADAIQETMSKARTRVARNY